MLDILKNLYYYKYLSLEKLNASFQNVQKKDQKGKKKRNLVLWDTTFISSASHRSGSQMTLKNLPAKHRAN